METMKSKRALKYIHTAAELDPIPSGGKGGVRDCKWHGRFTEGGR